MPHVIANQAYGFGSMVGRSRPTRHMAHRRHARARPHSSADEAVRAVRILQEVLGVPARIPASMLWKEHAIRVISLARTRPPNIVGPEALRKVSTGHCAAYVFDEPAHDAKCGIDEPGPSPSPTADRTAA